VLQTWLFFWYINRINQKVIILLDYVKSRDSGLTFKDSGSSSTFGKLEKRFAETRQILQDISKEKEIKINYLQFIIDYVDVGLFSFDDKGAITFINPAARKILDRKFLTNIKALDEFNPNFSETINGLKPGESEVIEIKRKDNSLRLSLNTGLFNIMGIPHKLISFQDIDKHLYKEEIDSWSKIIRILNHEIMNSITPITSLSKTMKTYFTSNNKTILPQDITPKIIDRTIEGLGIIEDRGAGLINFVNSYRKLTALPSPIKSIFLIKDQFTQVRSLMNDELTTHNILLKVEVNPDDLSVEADKEQIQQILINLLKNAIQATQNESSPSIIFRGFRNEFNNTIIQVEDNGVGMPDSIINNIFIPFFTTKDTGSGIGLSLSRQIMQMHNGTIKVQSEVGKGSLFSLVF